LTPYGPCALSEPLRRQAEALQQRQPHNEGDFTALGRVARGMEVVDRPEPGDKITGACFVTR
jgi:hypothetical protein